MDLIECRGPGSQVNFFYIQIISCHTFFFKRFSNWKYFSMDLIFSSFTVFKWRPTLLLALITQIGHLSLTPNNRSLIPVLSIYNNKSVSLFYYITILVSSTELQDLFSPSNILFLPIFPPLVTAPGVWECLPIMEIVWLFTIFNLYLSFCECNFSII